jgi:hypothetical protein
MSNPQGKGGFIDHPEHRNVKGRPRNFDELRELGLQIANEYLKLEPLTPEGKARKIRRIKIALTRLINSSNPVANKLFFEYTFGKVPQPLELSAAKTGEPITFNVHYIQPRPPEPLEETPPEDPVENANGD